MARPAKHYCGEEVRRLIENMARWPGWHGGHCSRSSIGWINDFVANRRQDELGPTIPVMGGEAADTQRALMRIDELLRECLVIYYTGRGTVGDKVHTLNKRRRGRARIGKSAFYVHVERAHHEFMTQYRELRKVAHHVEARNVGQSVHASTSVARRHRLIVRDIGLVEPSLAHVGEEPEQAADQALARGL
jgi:hypothetical protein